VGPRATSPWQRALGDRIDALHPALRTYFSAIPAGRVGRGIGSFDSLGTPRRWLWPVLAVLARRGILFPVWQRDVPFRIENRAIGSSLRATRTFQLHGGDRTMVDEVSMDARGLVDRLGTGGELAVELTATVVDGALRLVSGPARWRGLRIPFAPRLRLTERFDDAVGRQHVALTLESRLFGRIYEYSGHFDYRIEAS
jgi:hypothetical protein